MKDVGAKLLGSRSLGCVVHTPYLTARRPKDRRVRASLLGPRPRSPRLGQVLSSSGWDRVSIITPNHRKEGCDPLLDHVYSLLLSLFDFVIPVNAANYGRWQWAVVLRGHFVIALYHRSGILALLTCVHGSTQRVIFSPLVPNTPARHPHGLVLTPLSQPPRQSKAGQK